MDIVFAVKNQELVKTETGKYVEKSINYLKCIFVFLTEDWENTEKTAYFIGQDSKKYRSILKENACMIPWEAIRSKGEIIVALQGIRKDGMTITSSKQTIRLQGTICGGDSSKEPSPDEYEQIMQALAGKVSADQGAENAGKILGIGEDGVVAPVDAPAGSGSGAVSKDDIREAVEEYMKKNPVEVKTTDVVEKDNTLPVTSAGVYTVCGNIEALLQAL